MLDVQLFTILRARAWDDPDLLPQLEQLSHRTLRDRLGFFGLLLRLVETPWAPAEARRRALTCLAGARGVIATEAFVDALGVPELRATAVEELASAGGRDPALFAHAAFHPDVEVRRLAVARTPTPPTAEHFLLYLLADDGLRALTRDRIDFAKLRITARVIPTIVGLVASGGLAPADAARLLGQTSNLAQLALWAEKSSPRPDDEAHAIVSARKIVAPDVPRSFDPLDELLTVLAHEARALPLFHRLANDLPTHRFVASAAVVLGSHPDALPIVTALCAELPEGILFEGIPIATRLAALTGVASLGITRVVTQRLKPIVEAIVAWGGNVRHLSGLAAFDARSPYALVAGAVGGVDELARRIVAAPDDAAGLFALSDLASKDRATLVDAILAIESRDDDAGSTVGRAAEVLGLLISKIPVGEIGMLLPTGTKLWAARVLPLAEADEARRRAFADKLFEQQGVVVCRQLIAEVVLASHGSAATRNAWVSTLVVHASRKLDVETFVGIVRDAQPEARRAILVDIDPPLLLNLGPEIALAHALVDDGDADVRAWARERIPLPPGDPSPPPVTRAFAGVAYRGAPAAPDVAACVELLGSVDPEADTARAFLRWGSEDARFLADLDRALIDAYAYREEAVSPLCRAWLWRWDAHALVHLDDALARHGSLLACVRARMGLPSAVFRRASLEAIGSAIALLAYRDRTRLVSLLETGLLDALVDLLTDDTVASSAASAVKAIVATRLLDVRDAHARVRLLLPSLDEATRTFLADWVASDGLPPRRPPRPAALPTAAEVLDRVRSTRDPELLERFVDDERLDVVHEATLRLVEVGEPGVRRLLARIEAAREHAAVEPIVDSIALWPDGPSADRAFALTDDHAVPPELRFRLALAACERGVPAAPERALSLTRLGDPTGWFTERDYATLAGLALPHRLATLALSPHPHAYLRAVDELVAMPPDAGTRAALRAFLAVGTERLVQLRRKVAVHLHVQGDFTGLPIVTSLYADDAPVPSPLFVGLTDADVVLVATSHLAAGHETANEKQLVRQICERGVDVLGQEEALNLVLDRAAKNVARLAAAKALTRADLRERKLVRVARVFAWGARMGRRLLGKPMRVRMTGAQKLGYTRLRDNVVFVTPLPILRGDRHAEELVEALVLHELGHHLYHAGEGGLAVWKRAQDAKLHGLLNLVADEHLERNLRAVDPVYGDRLKRLAAYAFQHTGRDMEVDPLLGYLGSHAVRVLTGLTLGVARERGHVSVRSGRLLFGMEHDGLAFSRFVRALRMGLGNRHADGKVAEALALFQPKNGVEFKDLDMEGLWEIVRRLREIFGWETDLAEDIGGHEALDDSDGDVFGDGISQDDVDREVQRIDNPGKDGGGGTPGGRPWLNVSNVETFDRIKKVVRLVHDPARHAPYARAVSRPAAAMREFFERLGLSNTASRMRLTGNRVDAGRLRSLVLRGDPRVLVAREKVHRTDIFIGVCVDCSGSMTTRNNIERAKHFGVLLAEAVRPLEQAVDLRLFGFTDDTIFDCGNASRCAAHDLHTAGGNNDAAALFHAATVAKASRRKAKLLVMISDGLPTQCSVASLKGLVKHLGTREGMVVAQVAVQPISEVCFPHYVVVTDDAIDVTVKKFGGIISRLVERAVTSS